MKNEQHKKNLEKELKKVEVELKTVGRANPHNSDDWEAKSQKLDTDRADESEVAEKVESFSENTVIVAQLEIRRSEIKRALQKVEDGTYGVCEVCGKPIEDARLKANEAAATCVEHMK